MDLKENKAQVTLSVREPLWANIGSKWRDGRRYFMQIKTKRAGVAIVIWQKKALGQKL